MTAAVTATRAMKRAMRRRLMEILAPYGAAILVIACTILLGAALELTPPIVMKRVVDEHLAPGIATGLWPLAFIYLASVAGVQGMGFLSGYLTALTAQRALRDLRVRLYRHLQRLPLGYSDRTPLGDTISRCTADVDTLDTLFSSGVAGLVADLVRLVTVSAAMIVLSPPLSLVSALVVPPLLWVTNAFRKRIREAERRNRKAVGLMNSHLQETLGGLETIRAFRRESAFAARFRRILKETLDAYNQAARYSALYTPIMQILMAAVVALLLWSGAQAAFTTWKISLGTLTAFVLLFKRFFDPITALGEEWQTVQSALSGAERIFQILEMPIERMQAEGDSGQAGPVGASAAAGITVNGLTFGYFPDRTVLWSVSFAVQPGEHVALVGRTGAGKSSIVHLLGGLYAPWQGELRVAGLDPRSLPETGRRRVIGVVPQAVQLFSGTVLENLTLGDGGVPFEAVESAAVTAGVDGLIRALPQGYATPINAGSGGGVQLSSGQRQLLSLARGLVWNPSVLLFDEATSAIDSASEAAFRQALERESTLHRRAILTVAHRLSTARAAHRVIVLEHGRILETGSPDELIRKGGRFAAMLELEAAGWDWRNDVPSLGQP
jgi:ATP-binding cassette subfamily B multidrug efflux pump